MKIDYEKYDFSRSDLRNFLLLLSKEFKKRGLVPIPDGLILKKPQQVTVEHGNTSIDLVGIPFKKVFGRTKIFYYRIKLSEFADAYRVQLGTARFPIRMTINPNDEEMLENVKTILSKRTGVGKDHFVLTLKSKTENLQIFKFKFVIKPTEFTTEDEGLCLINDVEALIYVAEPNIKIQNGVAILGLEDQLTSNTLLSSNVLYESNEDRVEFHSTDGDYPSELRLGNLTYTPIYPGVIVNKQLRKTEGSRITGLITDDIKNFSVPGSASFSGGISNLSNDGTNFLFDIESGREALFSFNGSNGKKYIEHLKSNDQEVSNKTPIILDGLFSNTLSSAAPNSYIEVVTRKTSIISKEFSNTLSNNSLLESNSYSENVTQNRYSIKSLNINPVLISSNKLETSNSILIKTK